MSIQLYKVKSSREALSFKTIFLYGLYQFDCKDPETQPHSILLTIISHINDLVLFYNLEYKLSFMIMCSLRFSHNTDIIIQKQLRNQLPNLLISLKKQSAKILVKRNNNQNKMSSMQQQEDVAITLCEEFNKASISQQCSLNKIDLNQHSIEFEKLMKYIFDNCSNCLQHIQDIISRYKHQQEYHMFVSNMMKILLNFSLVIKNFDFSFMELKNIDLLERTFFECNFDGSNFQNVNITNCQFRHCSMKQINWVNVVNSLQFQFNCFSSKNSFCQIDSKLFLINELNSIRIRNIKNRKKTIQTRSQKNTITNYSHRSKNIFIGNDRDQIMMYNLIVKKQIRALKNKQCNNELRFTCPPLNKFMYYQNRNQLMLQNVMTASNIIITIDNCTSIDSVIFHPFYNCILYCSNGILYLYNKSLENLEEDKIEYYLLDQEGEKYYTLVISPNGEYLCADTKLKIKIFDFINRKALFSIPNTLSLIQFSMDSMKIIGIFNENFLNIWNMKGEQLCFFKCCEAKIIHLSNYFNFCAILNENKIQIRDMDVRNICSDMLNIKFAQFSYTNQSLIGIGEFNQLYLIESSQKLTLLHNSEYSPVLSLDISLDGNILAISHANSSLKFWKKYPKSYFQVDSLKLQHQAQKIFLSPKGDIIFSLNNLNEGYLHQRENSLSKQFQGKINFAKFQSQTEIYLLQDNKNLILWDLIEKKTKKNFILNFTPSKKNYSISENYFVAQDSYFTIKILNLKKQTQYSTQFKSNVELFMLSNDEQHLIVGQKNRTVDIWNIQKRSIIDYIEVGTEIQFLTQGFLQNMFITITKKCIKFWIIKNLQENNEDNDEDNEDNNEIQQQQIDTICQNKIHLCSAKRSSFNQCKLDNSIILSYYDQKQFME